MKVSWTKKIKEDLKQNWKGYAKYGFSVLLSWGLSSIGLGKVNPEDWARY